MTSLTIERHPEPPVSWNQLARGGSFYHDPRWVLTLGACFEYPLHCLTAFRAGEPVGALALAQVPRLAGPRRLVSLPFSYAAGPLADTAVTSSALLLAARECAASLGVGRLEIKMKSPLTGPEPGFTRAVHYSTYRVATDGGESAVWDRLHPDSTRRSIKKSLKSDLDVSHGTTTDDWLAMAQLEETTAHSHGVPSPPRRFFTQGCLGLQQAGLSDLYLARCREGGEAVAGIVLWKGPHEWIYAFGASKPAFLDRRPNHLLLWAALRDAIAAGVAFDLGRAAPEQEGLVEFKRRWGGQPIPLAYDYWPDMGGLNIGDRSRGPLALAATVWSRLPMSWSRVGSRFLYRYLG